MPAVDWRPPQCCIDPFEALEIRLVVERAVLLHLMSQCRETTRQGK